MKGCSQSSLGFAMLFQAFARYAYYVFAIVLAWTTDSPSREERVPTWFELCWISPINVYLQDRKHKIRWKDKCSRVGFLVVFPAGLCVGLRFGLLVKNCICEGTVHCITHTNTHHGMVPWTAAACSRLLSSLQPAAAGACSSSSLENQWEPMQIFEKNYWQSIEIHGNSLKINRNLWTRTSFMNRP